MRLEARPRTALATMVVSSLGVALAFAVPLSWGCSILVSTDNLSGGNSEETTCDGASCTKAPLVDAGHDAHTDAACTGSGCSSACPKKVMYVSTSGNDAATGCKTSTPKKTVGAAIKAVEASGAMDQEIHVCQGTYTEAGVTIESQLKLMGGYDCLAWVRSATYGYPTFDGLNKTVLASAASNASGVTLTVTGLSLTSEVVVDGFTLESPPAVPGGSDSISLAVVAGATPVISNNDITPTMSYAASTEGITVRFSAFPEIMSNRISGGGGVAGTFGIKAQQGASANIHDNTINAGMSANSTHAIDVGIALPMTGTRAIARNKIDGGVSGTGSVGIYLYKTAADVVDNVISGGSCVMGDGCDSVGIVSQIDGTGAITSGNLIYGGEAGGSSYGIEVYSEAAAQIYNNAIQAGSTASRNGHGIRLDGATNMQLFSNTIYGSKYPLEISDTSSQVSIIDNLIIGDAAGGSTGLYQRDCASWLTALTGNAFLDNGTGLYSVQVMQSNGTCNKDQTGTLTALEADFPGLASGNVRIDHDCSGETSLCITAAACDGTNDAACIQTVLAFWDADTQGKATLLDPTQTWKLADNASCGVAQGGGSDLVNSVATDLAQAMRTPPLSIGAYENDEACTP